MLIVYTKIRLYAENAEFCGERVFKKMACNLVKQSDTYHSESAPMKSESVRYNKI